jgi:hypothetical protein
VIGHVALLNGPTVFIRRSTATAQAWREDIVKGLVIDPSFKVRNEPESIKSIDPPLVLTEVLSYTCPIFRERSGNNPIYLWCRGIAETAQRVGERNLSESEDSKHVRKRVRVYPFTRSPKIIVQEFQKIVYPWNNKHSMNSMDCCRTDN